METALKILIGLDVVLLVTALYCAVIVGSNADDASEEYFRSKLIEQETTSVPMPEPTETPEPKTWVRYDVPLDDDLQRYIYELCQQYSVRPELVYAIIENESDYQADAISADGYDYGLMQVRAICHTARCVELGAWNLFDPKMNVHAGIDILAELLASEENEAWALSKYRGETTGPGNYSRTVLADAQWIAETAMSMEG